jgi:site-specific DNA recombinase
MSARKLGRPVFTAVMQEIEEGRANALIAYDISRLARNAEDGARMTAMLDSGKLRCIVTSTHIFHNNSMDKFLLVFLVAQSKLYTDSLSEVVKRGMNSKAAKGIFPGPERLGYVHHPKTKEPQPDPATMPFIVSIYEKYITCRFSLDALSKYLFRHGIKTRNGKPLGAQQVNNLLSDPFYYSAFVWCGELHQ